MGCTTPPRTASARERPRGRLTIAGCNRAIERDAVIARAAGRDVVTRAMRSLALHLFDLGHVEAGDLVDGAADAYKAGDLERGNAYLYLAAETEPTLGRVHLVEGLVG